MDTLQVNLSIQRMEISQSFSHFAPAIYCI